ncbi:MULTISPECIES: hypothetical protein [Paraburkholderia]|uniref:hypothetical protein n=1 Tax=Paraburkholderia TaxID=1822464 RepID=UPI0038BB16BF
MPSNRIILRPLNPTVAYPASGPHANIGVLSHYKQRGSISLSPPAWEALAEFVLRDEWEIGYSCTTLPRPYVARTHAELALKKKMALESNLRMVDYEIELPKHADKEQFFLLSSGLCSSIGHALESGLMEREAPELHKQLASQSIEWKECGGMHGSIDDSRAAARSLRGQCL